MNVARKVPKAELTESDLIPRNIDAVRTDVVETGVFRALQRPVDRWRPTIPPGVSIGLRGTGAGTFGCLVRRGDEIFILSNNHVLANVNAGRKGDLILQPGHHDGGLDADQIALLDDFVLLDFGSASEAAEAPVKAEPPGCQLAGMADMLLGLLGKKDKPAAQPVTPQKEPGMNFVDAALAKPLDPSIFQPDLLEIGRPKGCKETDLGQTVKKVGRSTGYTEGRIIQVDVTTAVLYGSRSALFTEQLMAESMSAPGDSGSIVLDEENYVIGLLYAGSDSATLINPINPVLKALNVELVI
jgi:hypothetical protein